MDPLHALEAELTALLSERAALLDRLGVVERDLSHTVAELNRVTDALRTTTRAAELAVAAELTRPSEPVRRLVQMVSTSAADDLASWPPVARPPAARPRLGTARWPSSGSTWHRR